MSNASESNTAFLDEAVAETDITLFLSSVARCIGSDDEEDLAEALDPVVSDFCDQEALGELKDETNPDIIKSYMHSYDNKSIEISNCGAREQALYLLASMLKAGKVTLPLTEDTALLAVQETGWFGAPLTPDFIPTADF